MIQLVIDPRRMDLDGFKVGRVLPLHPPAHSGSVRLLQLHEACELAARPIALDGRATHPHIGLSAITYLFSGEIMHRDSVGSEQPIRAAEVNWMTAGSVVTPSERFEKGRPEGDVLHGIQAWAALPDTDEEAPPAPG